MYEVALTTPPCRFISKLKANGDVRATIPTRNHTVSSLGPRTPGTPDSLAFRQDGVHPQHKVS